MEHNQTSCSIEGDDWTVSGWIFVFLSFQVSQSTLSLVSILKRWSRRVYLPLMSWTPSRAARKFLSSPLQAYRTTRYCHLCFLYFIWLHLTLAKQLQGIKRYIPQNITVSEKIKVCTNFELCACLFVCIPVNWLIPQNSFTIYFSCNVIIYCFNAPTFQGLISGLFRSASA